MTDAATPTTPTAPQTYADVPWFRKNWFAVVCFFIFAPGLIAILATGPMYYEKKGELKKYGMGARVAIGAISGLATWMWIASIFANPPQVYVSCQAVGQNVLCSVQHQSGDSAAKVCWTIRFTCANGTAVTGSACNQVGIGVTNQVSIPETSLTNLEQCDQTQSTAIEGITVEAI